MRQTEQKIKSRKLLVVGGGRSIHTRNFIELIGDYFTNLMLLTDYDRGNDDKNLVNAGKCIVDFSFRNPIKILRFYVTTNRLMKTYKPDFVACYQVDTAAFMTLFCCPKHIPVLITAMGSDILLNEKKGWLNRYLIKYVLNKAKYHNTGALHVAQQMQKLASKPLDIVIANLGFNSGISPKEKQNIIYSNRLNRPLYQIPKILKAFALFYEHHSDWRLVVAAVDDRQPLILLAKKLGVESAVTFLGWLNPKTNNHYYEISRI